MNWSIEQVVQITRGRLIANGRRPPITGVSTDSRSLTAGDLFVPLRGPHFNGHDFLAAAVQQGASACLSEETIAGFPVPVVQVEDTLRALGDLAAARRGDLAGPLVAVTGSSGKTTTKEMLAAILGQQAPGLKTEGNFNNLVGLPLTLLRLSESDRWAVLELGMSARGEIARLTEIARPDVGVITNVAPAHLAGLESLDGVARAKGELFAGLPAQSAAVVNVDDPRVAALPVANHVQRLLYGENPAAQVRAEAIVADEGGVAFTLVTPAGRIALRLAVPGRHQVANALAAAAAATVLAVPLAAIAAGLAAFQPLPGRLTRIPLAGGVTLLDDSYNANPLSVKAALATLADLCPSGSRVAVLGDMLELGAEAAAYHREIGIEAARKVDRLLVLGEHAAATVAGAREGGLLADQVVVVADHAVALECLESWLKPGDCLLVKGSRGMRLDRVCRELAARRAGAARG